MDMVREDRPDTLAMLGELYRLGKQMPPLMLPAEFALLGPILNLMIGGRSGAPAYRTALHLDNDRYIPAYRATLGALLRGLPGEHHLTTLIDHAITHDQFENTHLLAALDDLDPPDGAPPRVRAATRWTLPAAAHAATKFTLLTPALPPAVAVAAVHAIRHSLRPGPAHAGQGRLTRPYPKPPHSTPGADSRPTPAESAPNTRGSISHPWPRDLGGGGARPGLPAQKPAGIRSTWPG